MRSSDGLVLCTPPRYEAGYFYSDSQSLYDCDGVQFARRGGCMNKIFFAVMLLVLGQLFPILRDRREQREREQREWSEQRRMRWRK